LFLANEPGSSSGWFVSGPLANDAGLWLTQSEDGTLAGELPSDPPSAAQLFDFYF
jgi:hypothetical protein